MSGTESGAYLAAMEEHFVRAMEAYASLYRSHGRITLTTRPEDRIRAEGALDGLRQGFASAESRNPADQQDGAAPAPGVYSPGQGQP